MNHSDETNKIVGETPISDSTPRNVADFMLFRRLERELNEANEKAQRYYEAILKHKAENEHLTDKIHQLYEGAEEQKQRIKRLEEMYEGVIGERPELLGSNVMGLLKRELNTAQQRIKRLEEAGDKIVEAGWSVQDWSGMCVVWTKAKEAKP